MVIDNLMPFHLDAQDLPSLQEKLQSLGWLGPGETVESAAKAGEGNMNYTLRVSTAARTFIVKQSRAWVEKYPQIPAPEERAVIEGRFYLLISSDGRLASAMPKLLGVSAPDRMLALEDAGSDARDFSLLYAGTTLSATEFDDLTGWLARLHRTFRGRNADFDRNAEMRALNHEYIFVQPLTVGVNFSAAYRECVRQLGEIYLGNGPCLLHGDYFPGSWLQTAQGVRIIDPEFAFFGPPEFDAGVFLAHMYLAGQADPDRVLLRTAEWCDPQLTRRFAGVEIMRRILGVAQLPLRATPDEKRALLDKSKEFILE